MFSLLSQICVYMIPPCPVEFGIANFLKQVKGDGKSSCAAAKFSQCSIFSPHGADALHGFLCSKCRLLLAGHDNPKISLHNLGARVLCILMAMAELAGLRAPVWAGERWQIFTHSVQMPFELPWLFSRWFLSPNWFQEANKKFPLPLNLIPAFYWLALKGLLWVMPSVRQKKYRIGSNVASLCFKILKL